MDDKTKFTREDLYELIWSEPQKKVAETLGIKIWHLPYLCEKNDIPRPKNGYWTKHRLGRATPRPDLPPKSESGAIIFVREDSDDKRRFEHLDDDFRKRAEAALAKEEQPDFAVVVQEEVQKPHPVVTATRKCLNAMKEDSGGVVTCGGSERFSVRLTKSQIQRAMLILDAFLKACKKRGYTIASPRTRWDGETRILVLGKPVPVRLKEKTRQQERTKADRERDRFNDQKYEYLSTGVLTFEVGYENVSDKPSIPIEIRLKEVMIALIWGAMAVRGNEICEEEQQRREFEIQRKRMELNRLKREENERLKDLYQQAENWERSKQIRNYLEAAREYIVNRDGQVTQGGKLEAWLKWAEAQADRLDPLSPSPSSVLDEPDP